MLIAEGDEARRLNEQSGRRKKVTYARLKDGDKIRGYLLTTAFKMFVQHNSFEKGIKSHTCTDPRNQQTCLSCQLGVPSSKMTIVPFWNIDTKQVEVFLAKKKQMSSIYSFIDLYGDAVETTPIIFTRVGKDTSTVYNVIPAPPAKAAEKALWELPAETGLDDELYAAIVAPPDEQYLRKLLHLETDSSSVEPEITPIDGAADSDVKPF